MLIQPFIVPAKREDLPLIYQLFEEAILFQKQHHYTGWADYDKEYIKKDVEAGLLFKLVREAAIVCIFSVCYSDTLIWREREKGDALYLHRLVLNRKLQGQKVFPIVLDWAKGVAAEKGLAYIRMDTWAENEKLIGYYKGYGFRFIENYRTADTEELPVQHRNLNVALLELAVDAEGPVPQRPDQKVNIIEALSGIDTYWSQKIIGRANGQLIKLAKGIGAINWHQHDDQDELFLLFKGHLTIQLRHQNIELYPNDLYIVPKGVAHCPKADGEVEFLIMGLNITSNAAGGRPDNRFPPAISN
jgi:mannose-6-phosphate isomerase-like protein (cupin superfamily)